MNVSLRLLVLLLPYPLLAQSTFIEVPLQKVDRYLPKATSQVGTSQSVDFAGFRGIPTDLTEKVVRSHNTISGQTAYEAYQLGKLSREEWMQTKQGLGADTALLSLESVHQRINTLVGTDRQGRRVLIVDANNNQNFGDDRVLYYPMTLPSIPRTESGLYTNAIKAVYDTLPAIQVHTEAFDGQKIADRTTWIKPNPYNDGWTYKDSTMNRFHLSLLTHEHAKGSATVLGEPFNFVVTSRVAGMPYNTRQTTLHVYRVATPGSVATDAGEYKPQQWFVFNNRRIEFTGVSMAGDTLYLADRGPVGNEILRPSDK